MTPAAKFAVTISLRLTSSFASSLPRSDWMLSVTPCFE